MISIFVKIGTFQNQRVLEVSFTYHIEIVRFLKARGWRWEPTKRVWWVIFQTERIRDLELSFPNQVLPSLDLLILRLKRDLLLRNYSRRTVKTYLGQIQLFFSWLTYHKNFDDPYYYNKVLDSDVENYLEHSILEKKLRFATIRSIIQALRFFWREALNRPFPKKVKYPRKYDTLPDILSRNEVLKLVASLPNPKHKLLLLLAYSSGMRLSEIVSLKIQDLDFERGVIHVKMGKGKKDRIVPLSKTFQSLWIENSSAIQKSDNIYLFPGQYPKTHLTSRTAQKVFENARKASQTLKDVSFHSLRHAFATHLLEAGTGIRHIQTLLGHTSIRTTERYARLSKTEILKVPSPLDLD